MRRGGRIATCALALVVALPALALWALLATGPGSRWLLEQVRPLVPGELVIGHFEGTLAGPFTAREVRWRHGELDISLDLIEADLALWRLPAARLAAERLHLKALHIHLPAADDSAPAAAPAPPDIRLPLAIAIDDGRLEDLRIERAGATLLALDRVELERGRWLRRLRFERLAAWRDELVTSARGTLMLTPPHRLALTVDWTLPLPEAARAATGGDRLAGQATLRGDLSRIHGSHRLDAPFAVTSHLELAPFATPLAFDVDSRWQRIVLFPAAEPVTLEGGRLRLGGTLEAIEMAAATGIATPVTGAMQAELTARGDLQGAHHLDLTLQRGEALARATGSARWAPAPAVDVRIAAERLDPGTFLDGWPGRLALEGRLQGERHPHGFALAVSDLALAGMLRERDLKLDGSARLSPAGELALDARLDWGGNDASVTGTAGDELALRGRFALRTPEALLAALSGELAGEFSLAGSRAAPLLDLTARGNQLTYADLRVDAPTLRARRLGLASRDLELAVEAARVLRAGDELVRTPSLTLTGAVDDHRLHWRTRAGPVTGEGRLRGGLRADRSGWDGAIETLVLAPEDAAPGPWHLRQPVPLSIAPGRIVLQGACLDGPEGALCASLQHDPERSAVDARIADLPLAIVNLLLPALPATLEGRLDAEAALTATDGRWSGQAQAATRDAAMVVEAGEERLRLTLDTLAARAMLTDNRLDADARLDIDGRGHARLRLDADIADPAAAVDGALSVDLDDWRWLTPFMPQLDEVAGHLGGDLRLGGSRRRPVLTGRLAFRDGTARLPRAGLLLSDVTLDAVGDGTRIALSASARSGPGTVAVAGSLHPFPEDDAPLLQLGIEGERLEVVNLRDVHVLASPELTVRLGDGLVRVRGGVHIPEATIAPRQPPRTAIQVSEDQILVREDGDGERGAAPALDVEVTLTLGDAVSFSGFGLDASPRGRITLLQTPARPLRLRGELRLEQGRYRAYGQNLRITRGLLLFQDEPDNPGLDLRAVRRIPSASVEVGVQIGGTLREPEASIFSNPPMEQSEAMAWLLTGRGLSGASDSENARIAEALALYGLERGSGITEELGEKLGVDEISIGSTWETRDAALMLGKRLNDRLYLSYAAGLFDAVSTVMLRYTLSRRLHLEATTGGSQQSLDLIYQFEK